MKDLIKELTQKDDGLAYEKMNEVVEASKLSNAYYQYFDDFALLLNDDKSCIRTRGFLLCCVQARWDDEKIKKALPSMAKLFNDSKPTVVRQCLQAIKEVVIYLPDLRPDILKSLQGIDLSQYKDSMSPLIKKDVESVIELINQQLQH